MEFVEQPILPNRTVPCWTCSAGWRFYEHDVEWQPGGPGHPKEKFWITCEKCSTRINVTQVLTLKMRENVRSLAGES